MLTCGIIGLPLVGKTTLFNLLTSSDAETSKFQTGKTDANVGITSVPDKRIDWLNSLFNPKKTTYAQIEVTDIVGLSRMPLGVRGGNPFLAGVRDCDALIHVIRAFENEDVVHPGGSINLLRDFNDVWAELFLADLDAVEKRIARLEASKKKTKEMELELSALIKCREALESEKPIHTVVMNQDEKNSLKSFTFLTEKPMIVVLNVDERQLIMNFSEGIELRTHLQGMDIPMIVMSIQVEKEISNLELDDRTMFMSELGISEPGIDVLTRVTYAKLGLISFFTVGEDEVKAWTIVSGIDARTAAGKIHSDIERGFIRAEVVAYDVLRELGSVSKAREKGLYRLEGRDYIVKDGDITNFRFNA